MNKFIFTAMALLLAISFQSCSDDDNSSDQPSSTKAKLCIMYYSVGGKNLDSDQVNDIAADMNHGSSDDVKMLFQYKLSKCFQDSTVFGKYKGVIRFDLDKQKAKVGKFPTIKHGYDIINVLDNISDIQMLSTNPSYDMGTAESLTSFINWCISLHPAEKYMLIIGDHGGGWSIRDDGKAEQTRSVLGDDNTGSSLTSVSVTKAINGSNLPNHRLDYLLMDCCLMGQWENVYEYASTVDYLTASIEYSYGGYHEYLLPEMKANASNINSAMKNFIDKTVPYVDADLTDMGFYDLSKLSSMTTVLTKASKLIEQKYQSDALKLKICSAFSTCYTPTKNEITLDEEEYKTIKKYGFKPDIKRNDDKQYSVDAKYLHEFHVSLTDDEALEEVTKILIDNPARTICLSSLLTEIATLTDDAELKQLNNEYQKALNDMVYIKMTQSSGKDPYEVASTTITGASFKDGIWKIMLEGDPKTGSEAFDIYSASTFSKATGWANVLRQLDVNPLLFTNRFRSDDGTK